MTDGEAAHRLCRSAGSQQRDEGAVPHWEFRSPTGHPSPYPSISEALLRDMIETGEVRYNDETRIWIAKHYGDRADNLLCVAAALETSIGDQDGDASLFVGVWIMKTIYYPQDDILEIRLSDKPVAREVSQDWNVNVSYAEDGSVVELVILDAVKAGFMPFEGGDRKAA